MSASTLLNSKAIAEVAAGSASALRKFDRHGLFPAPGEDHQQFADRLSRLAAALNELKKNLEQNGSVEPCSGIKLQKNSAIPGNITGEALEKTCRLYDVNPDWVPGFFADESFGMLWGGCALSDPASTLVLFIIRKVFLKKRKTRNAPLSEAAPRLATEHGAFHTRFCLTRGALQSLPTAATPRATCIFRAKLRYTEEALPLQK